MAAMISGVDMRTARWLLFVVVMATVACSGARVKPDVVYEGSHRSYLRVLDNWTRSDKIYQNFETDALITATYFSVPMRRAYAAEWTRAFDLPAAESEAMLADQLAQAARGAEFVVQFYTPRMRENDLLSPESSWRLWLIDAEGRKVAPAKISLMKVRHRQEYDFYPIYSEFGQLYRVLFPVVGEDGRPLKLAAGMVRLRVTGVRGLVDLVWDIPPSAQPGD